nr:hypothetical protein [Tanacetum cinerariifolium]
HWASGPESCKARTRQPRHEACVARRRWRRPAARSSRRARVEDVDVPLIAEAFGLEHGQRRFGAGVYTTDDIARGLREEAAVQREFRHQFGNERAIADAGQVIRLAKLHLEEVTAQAFPERRVPFFIGHAAHLGDDFRPEQLREFGDEQHPRLGQQATVKAVSVVGVPPLGLAAEGLFGPADPVRQTLFIGRQRGQACACAVRQLDQRRKVTAAYGTNDHAFSSTRFSV